MSEIEKTVLFWITALLAISVIVTGIMTQATGLDAIYRDLSGICFVACLVTLLYELVSVNIEIK